MSRVHRAAALVALAGLGACGSPSPTNEAVAPANGNAAKPTAGDLGPEAESFVGRWSADGNCAHFMVLGRDGSYTDYNGTTGSWRPVREHIEVYLDEQPMIVERMDLTRC